MVSFSATECYVKLRDDTIKMVDPLSTAGIVVRVNTQRSKRPLRTDKDSDEPLGEWKKCHFCTGNEYQTPPEKGRVVLRDGEFISLDRLPPEDALFRENWEFRRIPNLFEIIGLENWTENYDFRPSKRNAEWKGRYLPTPTGRAHCLGGDLGSKGTTKGVLSAKLGEALPGMPEEAKVAALDPFFFGTHELIIARRHYKDGATKKGDRASSGELTPDEHFAYMKSAIEAVEDIYKHNRYVRFVNVFQNWLAAAGASADHLHKQLVGNDEWGGIISDYSHLSIGDPNVFNAMGVNLHAHHNLVFAENEHAIAYAAIGKINPAVVVFSKSRRCRPMELEDKELRGFSDVLHACHAAMGSSLPCNEEWLYMPRDSNYKFPFHTQVEWRVSLPAGLEYLSRIYISLLGPEDVKYRMLQELGRLRDGKRIAGGISIGEECPADPNCLQYIA